MKSKRIAASTVLSVFALSTQTESFALGINTSSSKPAADIESTYSGTVCHKQYEKTPDKTKFLECAKNLLKEADSELNKKYKHTMKHGFDGPLAQESRKLLRASQRAWIKFRDADCKRTAVVAGGTADADRTFCQLYHTELRTAQLNGY